MYSPPSLDYAQAFPLSGLAQRGGKSSRFEIYTPFFETAEKGARGMRPIIKRRGFIDL